MLMFPPEMTATAFLFFVSTMFSRYAASATHPAGSATVFARSSR